ncbi:MAG: M28 family peptidase [Christensenellales bacterium]
MDNEVEIGTGVTYNIMGKIRGKSSDYQILVGGHYDMHFFGFQDDNCAVGLVLAMAKAMKDSGYQPENDIVFCLHGAEEWGASYSQFDWTVGAWEMINHVHPSGSAKRWRSSTSSFRRMSSTRTRRRIPRRKCSPCWIILQTITPIRRSRKAALPTAC